MKRGAAGHRKQIEDYTKLYQECQVSVNFQIRGFLSPLEIISQKNLFTTTKSAFPSLGHQCLWSMPHYSTVQMIVLPLTWSAITPKTEGVELNIRFSRILCIFTGLLIILQNFTIAPELKTLHSFLPVFQVS